MARRALAIFAGVAAALVPLRAHADSIEASFGGEVVETSHRVTAARHGERVVLTVRRQLESRSDHPEELRLGIELPSAAVVDRFRYLVGGRWREGVLLPRDAAEELYEQLTGSGPAARRGPALMQWAGDGRVGLRVFPVPAGGTVTVEYRLTAPLCYERGYYLADYPARADERDAQPVLTGARVLSAARLASLLGRADLDGLCAGLGNLRGDDGSSYVVFGPGKVTGPATVTLGHATASATAHVVRLEVRVPTIIEPAPVRPRVVFVLDASRSVGEAGFEEQLALARGYLAHTPDAMVELVIYRRRAHRLFGRFVAARSFDAELGRLAPHRLELGNGSNLEAGLALAAQVSAGRNGPTRLVAFTDDRLSARFEAAGAVGALAAAPRDAVLHVVRFGSGAGPFAWDRDDDHRLVPVVRARGGVVAVMTGDDGGASEAMLGLVRPLSIDHVTAELSGVAAADLGIPPTFAGGDGYRTTLVATQPPTGARVTGLIWGRAWTVPLVADAAISRDLPALVFGHEAHRDLDDEAAAALARRGSVVSPFTSFLARDPSAPPTAWEPDSLYGISATCGCSRSHSIGVGHRGSLGVGRAVPGEPPDRIAILRGLLRDPVRACLGPNSLAAVSIDIETTSAEIVDVNVQRAPAAAATCIAEAAWSLHLPATIFTIPADAYPVTF